MSDSNQRKPKTPFPMDLPPDFHSFGENTASYHQVESEDSANDGQQDSDFSNQDLETKKEAGGSDLKHEPKISGYTIEKKLGQGGMGSVFLATDTALSRKVAIKVVSLTFQENTGLKERFESEIKTLASLHHSNIAGLFSAGTYQDLPYFVMEFVDGPTLESYAKQPLPATEAAKMVSKLCSAVNYCHENGVLHRDLKPSNVILDQNKQPKIADFGLAKAIGTDSSSTRTGEIIGTPGYMAPEQASGVVKTFTEACDVYALGAILYRLLTGRPPFVAAEPLQVVMQVLTDDPIHPKKLVKNIPADLQTICLKCLSKNPDKRYQSAGSLGADLERYLEGRPIKARPAGLVETSFKWIKRNPIKSVLGASVVILAIALGVGLSWHNRVLSDELAKTKRLADHGSDLSTWLINDQLAALNSIAGTTKIRHDLAERVSEFLDASYADIPSDPKYTRRLGNSYARLAAISGGEDQNNLGNHQQAVEYYLKAIDLYEQAIENDGDDSKTVLLHARSQFELSNTYQELKKVEESRKYFDLAKTSWQRCQAEDWGTVFLGIQIASREARDLMTQNKNAEAIAKWSDIRHTLDDSKDVADPVELEHQQILLATHLGECHQSLGHFKKADTAFRKAVELAEATALKSPDHTLLQRRWSSCLDRLGNLLYSQDNPADALKYYLQARDITKKILDADKDSVETSISLAVKLTNISDVYFYQQNLKAAGEAIEQAISIYQTVQKNKRLGLYGKRQLAICMQSYANILNLGGDTSKALEELDKHQSFCLGLVTEDKDSVPELTQLAENHFRRSLLILSLWMKKGFDPKIARQSKDYLKILSELEKSDQYFDRIEKTGSLNSQQKEYRRNIKNVRNLVEETIDRLLKAENQSNSDSAGREKF